MSKFCLNLVFLSVILEQLRCIEILSVDGKVYLESENKCFLLQNSTSPLGQ